MDHTTNLLLSQEIINKQKENNGKKWVLDEIGANVTIAHTLQELVGSSSVIHKAVCTYNQADQVWNPEGYRSVSSKFIELALKHYSTQYPDQNIFINSFQVESDPKKTTHGYIGIKTIDGEKIAHITVPQPMDRTGYQKTIGNIGLQLIHSLLSSKSVDTPHIDQIYSKINNKFEQDLVSTIEHMRQDSMVCINQNGQLCRMEDLTRTRDGYQPLIIYKGSFNPPHNGHLNIMETVKEKHPSHIAIFSISVDTYDKGQVDPNEIIKRVKLLNTLGYPVVLFGSGYFKDNLDLLRYKNNQQIIFPVGVDTTKRLIETYNNIKEFEIEFPNTIFEEFSRDGFDTITESAPNIIKNYDSSDYSALQARHIRGNIDEHIDKIPQKIQALCKELYS